jgi:branched-chain amino acid aminotransferase
VGSGCAYIDGRYLSIEQAKISVLDQGFTHSDAVYDVVSVWKGHFFRLDEHIVRFLASCQGWKISCPLGHDEIRRLLAKCVIEGDLSDAAYVAIVATRGEYIDAESLARRDILRTRTTLLAYAVPYQWIASPVQQERGIHLMVSSTPRIPEACVSAKCKNYHWGDLTRGKIEAREAGVDEAVHLTVNGHLTEGAGFNVFFVKSGRLYTPSRNVLEGVTRAATIDMARELGIGVELGNYTEAEFCAAEEAFITSTAGGIMPVRAIGGKSFASDRPGPLSTALRAKYWERREQGWGGTRIAVAAA